MKLKTQLTNQSRRINVLQKDDFFQQLKTSS